MILSQYNEIIDKAISLFGTHVSINEEYSMIKIKTGNICVVFLCSSNEYKVYIRTYDIPQDVKEMEGEIYYKIMKECGINVRLMDINSITTFLLIKKMENDFLTNNAY